jgi:hypothetical protein
VEPKAGEPHQKKGQHAFDGLFEHFEQSLAPPWPRKSLA